MVSIVFSFYFSKTMMVLTFSTPSESYDGVIGSIGFSLLEIIEASALEEDEET
jgi:hypothetical protein